MFNLMFNNNHPKKKKVLKKNLNNNKTSHNNNSNNKKINLKNKKANIKMLLLKDFTIKMQINLEVIMYRNNNFMFLIVKELNVQTKINVIMIYLIFYKTLNLLIPNNYFKIYKTA